MAAVITTLPHTIRLLIPDHAMSVVIGTRGETIRAIRAASGAHAILVNRRTRDVNRTLTIIDASVDVIMDVIMRIVMELAIRNKEVPPKTLDSKSGFPTTAHSCVLKLLVYHDLVGSLIGFHGNIIKDMRVRYNAQKSKIDIARFIDKSRAESKILPERLITLTASTTEHIRMLAYEVVQKIVDCKDRTCMNKHFKAGYLKYLQACCENTVAVETIVSRSKKRQERKDRKDSAITPMMVSPQQSNVSLVPVPVFAIQPEDLVPNHSFTLPQFVDPNTQFVDPNISCVLPQSAILKYPTLETQSGTQPTTSPATNPQPMQVPTVLKQDEIFNCHVYITTQQLQKVRPRMEEIVNETQTMVELITLVPEQQEGVAKEGAIKEEVAIKEHCTLVVHGTVSSITQACEAIGKCLAS